MKLALSAVALCMIALGRAPGMERVEIRVLFDNTVAAAGYEDGWGFAAAVSGSGGKLLFDAGASPDVLLRNADRMSIDVASFERVLVSHRHGDHTGGLPGLRKRNPALEILWPDRPEPFDISPSFHSTGALSGAASEQALVIDTPKGLVILTGCSHPGVVRLVEAALAQRKASRVRLLVGGFHMLQYTPAQVSETIAALRKLGVERVGPTHCTGAAAIAMFRDTWGKEFETVGAGRTIVIE